MPAPPTQPSLITKISYQLGYGTDMLGIQQDALGPGQRVPVWDDLLATGGRAGATASPVRQLGAKVVGAGFAAELSFLDGPARCRPLPTGPVWRGAIAG